MQDPHVDIAMFAIYALYEKEQIDQLIDAYFTEGCPEIIRTKIYCYIAICGFCGATGANIRESLEWSSVSIL